MLRSLVILILCFGVWSTASAQVGALNTDLTLITEPVSPAPRSEITVSLNAYTIDTTGAEIIWLVDGTEVVAAKNTRSLTLTTKELGESTTVVVKLTLSNSISHTITRTITPTQLDLVLEPQTLTPTFYQGRALPSAGSLVRAVAIPHLSYTAPEPDRYTYLWKLDSKVLFGGPLRGGNVAEFDLGLARNTILTVTVTNHAGDFVAQKSVVVTGHDPELLFYEENPLRGINNLAIIDRHIMVGEETTFRAEPYYFSPEILTNNALMEWSINGGAIQNPNADPFYLTLRRGGAGGVIETSFHLRNLDELTQGVEADFNVHF